eukprot:3339705-Amphidinium_carterae.2
MIKKGTSILTPHWPTYPGPSLATLALRKGAVKVCPQSRCRRRMAAAASLYPRRNTRSELQKGRRTACSHSHYRSRL